jgi:hypothetical protein
VTLALGLLTAGRLAAEEKADPTPLIDKCIQAHGGEAKLAQTKVCTWRAKVTYPDGRTFVSDVCLQGPDQLRMAREEVGGKKEKEVEVVNRGEGYAQRGGKTEEMSKEAMAQRKQAAHRMTTTYYFLPLKEKTCRLEAAGEAKVGDRAALVVKVSHPEQREFKIFLDKETGLLLKNEQRVVDRETGKEVTQETFYSNHKEIDGIKRAMTIKIVRDGKPYRDIEIVEFKARAEKLPDAHFAKP